MFGKMLSHEMSEVVSNAHWGIRAVVFAKHRNNVKEACRLFRCGDELSKRQKRCIASSLANLQVEERKRAHQLVAENERSTLQNQIVMRDRANLQIEERKRAHGLPKNKRTAEQRQIVSRDRANL